MATPSAEVASAALHGGGSDSRAAGGATGVGGVVATPSAVVASAALYGGGSDSRAAGVVTVESTAGCGVKPPHGKHSSGQLCRRKDGSVALQWVTSTKTDALSKVPRTPDGRDICWADWCHIRCEKDKCPD